MNLYAFVQNAPLIYVDEYGLLTMPLMCDTNLNAQPNFDCMQQMLVNTLTNPRFQGAVQAMAGFAEMSAGAAVTFESGFLAAPLGGGIIVHGCDQFVAGMNKMITGVHRDTAAVQVMKMAGLSSDTATLANDCVSIAGCMTGVAVEWMGQGMTPWTGSSVSRRRVR